MQSHPAKRALACAGVTATAILALALPAAAHVTINPKTAEPGGYGAFDVRVPNEEPDSDTTKVELYLPTDHPIASVSVQPVPGWTAKATEGPLPKPVKTDDGEVTEGVTRITWTGGKIRPGEFQQFGVSLGPLPTDTDTLYFKAAQTYTDKDGKTEVVNWAEIPKGGGHGHGKGEPEHPAPSITLTKPAEHAAASAMAGRGDTTGMAVGAAGLVVAILALGTAGFALRRSGRTSGA